MTLQIPPFLNRFVQDGDFVREFLEVLKKRRFSTSNIPFDDNGEGLGR